MGSLTKEALGERLLLRALFCPGVAGLHAHVSRIRLCAPVMNPGAVGLTFKKGRRR